MMFVPASAQLGGMRKILARLLDDARILLNDLGHRLRQSYEPAIYKAVQQRIDPDVHENREHQEESCYQKERRLADQTTQGFHAAGSGSSNIYPAPRTVAINWGEKSRSIFARRARIWASTMFVMGS